jgi:hypothetical protein
MGSEELPVALLVRGEPSAFGGGGNSGSTPGRAPTSAEAAYSKAWGRSYKPIKDLANEAMDFYHSLTRAQQRKVGKADIRIIENGIFKRKSNEYIGEDLGRISGLV